METELGKAFFMCMMCIIQAVKLASALQSCEGRVIGVCAYIYIYPFLLCLLNIPPPLYYTSSVSLVFLETI